MITSDFNLPDFAPLYSDISKMYASDRVSTIDVIGVGIAHQASKSPLRRLIDLHTAIAKKTTDRDLARFSTEIVVSLRLALSSADYAASMATRRAVRSVARDTIITTAVESEAA